MLTPVLVDGAFGEIGLQQIRIRSECDRSFNPDERLQALRDSCGKVLAEAIRYQSKYNAHRSEVGT
jgi:hypothetical protein